ncbi:MAG: glycosyl transferase family 90 [Candidatus Marinimicrobia bacterium]|nr:glycosyl transferase family 90 [Candidatus Neomarinimicrobiota bacterium]
MNKLKYKNIKSFYYLRHFLAALVPRIFYRLQLQSELKKIKYYDKQYIFSRLNYYNKRKGRFKVSKNAMTNKELFFRQINIIKENIFKKNMGFKKYTTYFFDLYKLFSFFDNRKKLDFIFGDITKAQKIPTLVKSRPIINSDDSIILNLNKVRHFHFINDHKKFLNKKNKAVWRGYGENSEARQYFLKNYHHISIFNVGQTGPILDAPWVKNFMSITEQLDYKFIFCIEGVDTATSIKWVMSSNSVCVMPKPKYETWFMEGALQPDVHYIEISDDFSNAEQKIKYFIEHPNKVLNIIKNAQAHVEQFKHAKREKLISLMVLDKYFSLSGQNNE